MLPEFLILDTKFLDLVLKSDRPAICGRKMTRYKQTENNGLLFKPLTKFIATFPKTWVSTFNILKSPIIVSVFAANE